MNFSGFQAEGEDLSTKQVDLRERAQPKDLERLYLAIQAARFGREILLKYRGRLKQISEKFQAGLVSEADRESEKAIFDFLRRHFPEDEFVGEESTGDVDQLLTSGPGKKGRWIVDPLDGTTNYIHQFPVFCVSIGYEYQGVMQMGVIDVPAMGEVYTAIRGAGAYMNGSPICVSRTEHLKDSLLATGFIPDFEDNLKEQLNIFSDVVRGARGVRRAGAAAYDLCMVARGVFDGYWEKNLRPWDSAAGCVLVEEAGGLVTSYRGKNFNPYLNSIIAGNPQVVSLLQKKIQNLVLPSTH